MKNCLSILSLLLVMSTTGFAQSMSADEQLETNFMSSTTTPIFKGYKGTTGSIYMNENFTLGSVIMNGKVVATNVALRYNVQDEQIELTKKINSGATVANVIKKDSDIHVSIDNQTLVYLPSADEDLKDGYFIVIQEGDALSLYKKLIKDFVEGKVSVNSIARTVPDMFKEREFLYVKNSQGDIKKVSNSKSKRRSLFVGKEEEIKNYAKENKLNLRNDEDFTAAIKYYNTLF